MDPGALLSDLDDDQRRAVTTQSQLVAVVASARDTALRGIAPIIAGDDLPAELDDLARGDEGFEALFQVTGQQGADLSERLLVARERR